jgi:hypothetical protein
VKSVDVPGQQVVLDNAPIDGPEGGNDGVVTAVVQGRLLGGFTASQVRGGLGLDHLPGDTQGDLAVDTSVTTGLLRVVVLDGDLVAEEPGRACAGVGDQRLVPGEFQLEFVAQELGQALFDVLGLGLRAGEPEQMVICLWGPVDYADRGVMVLAGELG